MKKYILFTIVLLFAILLCGCSKKEKPIDDLAIIKKRGYLIVGVKEDSPPFGYIKNKKREGIDIELAKNIANSIFKTNSPQNIEFVSVSAYNRISKLNKKEVDILVATMSINEKRKLVINFSTPYFRASQKLMVKKNSKITHIKHFNKQGKLAVVIGTTGEKILHFIAPNARVVGAKSYPEAIKLLENSKVDGILGDDCILEGLLKPKFKIINKAYSFEYYAVAARKSEYSKELLEQVNEAIKTFLDKNSKNIKMKNIKMPSPKMS